MSCQSGGASNFPKFGLSFPARILSAVDLPMPFVPTRPSTSPGRGVGSRCSLNVFGPYRCVVSFSRFFGRLMIWMASKGHFFTQMPQPMQSVSERKATLSVLFTSMHSFPIFTTGQDFLHSCLHFFGLHRSAFTMATRVSFSSPPSSPLSFPPLPFFGGILAHAAALKQKPSRAE